MANDKTLEILKEAILLERRGHAFYQKMADHARNNATREFFQVMANEELRHQKVMEAQFKSYKEKARFTEVELTAGADPALSDLVLTDTLKAKIAAAGFEAAAISAAMHMEEETISLYAHRAVAAQDPKEKALFRWLADWEYSHLTFLAKLDREIKASIWEDNHFWPM
ncbi:MAG: ferritin family protein [Desulfobacteraceae bacterium]|nr:ferritin family protein [Desulfobacteraceae bacterium]